MIASPRLYASFLLWLLSELFETLPEVGDPDKPKLVFFFDEAHLLFDDAPKALIDKVEQVARLIRSKRVGVYFVTQSPTDIPEDILGQLGNRVQHALRAYTAMDQKALRLAADTYRTNPNFDTAKAILEVGVGEAVTSFLLKKGVPGVVERTLIRPPSSQLGPITSQERASVMAASPVAGKYETPIDRLSAHEILRDRANRAATAAEQSDHVPNADPREFNAARRYSGSKVASRTLSSTASRRSKKPETLGEALGQALVKELSGTTGQRIIRGILGGFFKAR